MLNGIVPPGRKDLLAAAHYPFRVPYRTISGRFGIEARWMAMRKNRDEFRSTKKQPVNRSRRGPPTAATRPVGVRIIGGKFRGRKLEYSGDPRTRPMKDRVREALFNLLGHGVEGKVAIDLFAGTGALALEALSRGRRGQFSLNDIDQPLRQFAAIPPRWGLKRSSK